MAEEKPKKKKKRKKVLQIQEHYLELLEKKPLWTAVILIVLYFLMEYILLDVVEDAGAVVSSVCILLALGLFYSLYVAGYQINYPMREGKDIPAYVEKKRRFVLRCFRIMTLLTIIIPLGYDEIIIKWMPNLRMVYYESQVYLYILIAPIFEELTFRYFLYDKWARPKWGALKGFLISGILFVICHPVANLESMVLYWVPTLLFYLVYDSFGLYGSIAAHMIFNFIAL